MANSNLNQRFDSILWRKRDNQGNLLDTTDLKDIFVPFKSRVSAGSSTFDVYVPRTYLNRIFSFDNIMLIPDLYVDQAQSFNLETDEELDQILSYEMYLKVDFDPRNVFYPGTFDGIAGSMSVSKLCNDANIFFESKKPNGTKHMGCFFDWVDLRFANIEGEDFDAYVKSMALVFYGVPFNPKAHFNILPQSARTVPGANNYLFPTEKSEDLLQNIRIRLCIAPFTNAFFSTDSHLKSMGFSENQIGPRTGRKQFIMKNDSKTDFRLLTADNPYSYVFIERPSTFHMFLHTESNFFISESNYVGLTKRDALKNENFEIAVRNTLRQFEDQCNLQFGFSYEPNSKKFAFSFPQNINMKNMRIVLVPDLAERLGFELHREITEDNRVGHKIEDKDTKDTEEKARALAHETGLVIVSDFNCGSNTTLGINDKFMASLYPTETGTMVVHINELCNEKPTMTIRDDIMTPPLIPVTFLLSRFLDKSKLVNLVWKESFTMQGTLRGIYPNKKE